MSRRFGKYALAIMMALVVAVACGQVAFAHPTEEEHDAELEQVLFGKKRNDDAAKKLEEAAYLCIDYSYSSTNKKGDRYLEDLRSFGVADLPEQAADINIEGGKHRQWTHCGWEEQANQVYMDDDKRKIWGKRRSILRNTVYKLCGYSPLPDWMPFVDRSEEKKYEAFCALVYDIHILGDILEDHNYSEFNNGTNGRKMAFARPTPGEGNTDMFYELKKHLSGLFVDQADSRVYKDLISQLDDLARDARNLSRGSGVNSDEKYQQAHEYAEELMAILSGGSTDHANRIHSLLLNEEFFQKAFPELEETPAPKGWLEELLSRFGLAA